MIGDGTNQQIRMRVVTFVAVDVMHNLMSGQWPTQDFLCYQAMFSNALIGFGL